MIPAMRQDKHQNQIKTARIIYNQNKLRSKDQLPVRIEKIESDQTWTKTVTSASTEKICDFSLLGKTIKSTKNNKGKS